MNGLFAQTLRFALVGLANTAIGLLAIYGLILFFNAGPVVANVVGYALGFWVSYLLNRRWTFADQRPARSSLPRYMALAAVAYGVNLAVVLAGTHYLAIGRYLVQLLGIGFYTSLMFVGSRYLVFTPVPDSALLENETSR